MLGGPAAVTLLAGIRDTLFPGCPPRATRDLEVRLARHGQHASFVGLTQLIVDRVYGPEAINRTITG